MNRSSRTSSPAFTLIELLVVIGIIVLVVLLTLPVLNVLQGNRSADAAQNQIQALINEARMNAIALQRDSGVMFYIDPSTRRINTVLVQATDSLPVDPPNVDVFLDLVRDHESVPLTLGLSLQTMDNATVIPGSAGNPSTRSDDGYIGYNNAANTIQYGGVILFDSHGELVCRTYGFRTIAFDNTGNPIFSEMAKLLYVTPPPAPLPWYVPGLLAGAPPPNSSFGFVVFNSEAYKSFDCSEADAQQEGGGFVNKKGATLAGYNAPGTTSRTEQEEEQWIDANSVPFLINRYNGTLVRGE